MYRRWAHEKLTNPKDFLLRLLPLLTSHSTDPESISSYMILGQHLAFVCHFYTCSIDLPLKTFVGRYIVRYRIRTQISLARMRQRSQQLSTRSTIRTCFRRLPVPVSVWCLFPYPYIWTSDGHAIVTRTVTVMHKKAHSTITYVRTSVFSPEPAIKFANHDRLTLKWRDSIEREWVIP